MPLSGLRIVKGADKLSLYQFDTKKAKHYFCSVCDIYTHHQRGSNPNQFGINLGCLQNVDPCLIEELKIYDGANNHPSDRPASWQALSGHFAADLSVRRLVRRLESYPDKVSYWLGLKLRSVSILRNIYLQ